MFVSIPYPPLSAATLTSTHDDFASSTVYVGVFPHWKFCPNDGQKIEGAWKHCPQCGAEIPTVIYDQQGEPRKAANAGEQRAISCIDRRIETLRKMYVEDRKRCEMESAATRREAALWLQFARSESLGLDPYASENKLRDWDKD
jgi:hypothetical protein